MVIHPVPPGATVVGIPGKVVKTERPSEVDLEHAKLPDPFDEAIKEIINRQNEIEERIHLILEEVSRRQKENAVNIS